MTATLTPPTRRAVPPPVFDLDAPAAAPGRRRKPELAAGVLVILVCALGALWWQAASTKQTEVLSKLKMIEGIFG